MYAPRLSRLRKSRTVRDSLAQIRLCAEDLVLPYFVVEGKNIKRPIASMPGVYHFSIDRLIKDLSEIKSLHSILLFGVPKKKDNASLESYRKSGVLQKAIATVKKEFNDLLVISDVCLCAYTRHGHCGIIRETAKSKTRYQEFKIDNEATLKVLAKIALSHAQAGADFVAPSAMVDGQVKAIRTVLDKYGFDQTSILAYSAKFASNFYGPFRDALNSTPQFGDRKTYQIDFRNSDDALREIEQDIQEGADIVMVKPALAYLDVIYRAKKRFKVPIAAYNVSGEYSMIKKLYNTDKKAQEETALEILSSIKRAGADMIISYFTRELIDVL